MDAAHPSSDASAVRQAKEGLGAKQWGELSRTLLDQKRSSDTAFLDIGEYPVQPTEFTMDVRTLCKLRRYKEARGNCDRRKLKDPMIEPSALQATISLLNAAPSHRLISCSREARIDDVICSVSDVEFQSHPRKGISCVGDNEHFASDNVYPKCCKNAAIWSV
jgi:hypothetical protein